MAWSSVSKVAARGCWQDGCWVARLAETDFGKSLVSHGTSNKLTCFYSDHANMLISAVGIMLMSTIFPHCFSMHTFDGSVFGW